MPRYQLSQQERQRCLKALLSERHARRLRRADAKEGDTEQGKKIKKATRKKAAKLTTQATERAESKGEDAPADTAERTDPVETKGGAATVSAPKRGHGGYTPATDTTIAAEETAVAAASTPAEPPSENRSKQHKYRAVLQDDVDVVTSEAEGDGAAPRQLPPLKCVVV
ncbi:putative pleiotropic drug resistance protein [Phytophthora cinnamomi]|uniref:putative pleiotropic drug resistance protein n=1 Tax=Phytophthora cinnamomi TaxID=4785 RepID=UPI00355A8930|nr:putative pleiotropic drug resistance protein [Phytophthora cinnamomi]